MSDLEKSRVLCFLPAASHSGWIWRISRRNIHLDVRYEIDREHLFLNLSDKMTAKVISDILTLKAQSKEGNCM